MNKMQYVSRCVIAIFLCFTLGLFLTACGDSQQTNNISPNDPIIIGDLMAYTGYPDGADAWRNGMKLALMEINAGGGVLGRPIKVMFRDSYGEPGKSLRAVQELVQRDRVDILTGTVYDHVGLAITSFAEENDILFLRGIGGNDQMVGPDKKYTFRIGPRTTDYSLALAKYIDTGRGKLDWAFLAPDYAYGRTMVNAFRQGIRAYGLMADKVYEQYSPTLNLEAGPTVNAIERADPEGIFIALFGADTVKFLRQGRARNLFNGRLVVSAITGEPEELSVLGDDIPTGWVSGGYPFRQINRPAHQEFLTKYRDQYRENPRRASLYGYMTLTVLAKAIEQAGSTDTDALITVLESHEFGTPVQSIRFDPATNQSNIGFWIGQIGRFEGKPALVDWKYYRPEEVR